MVAKDFPCKTCKHGAVKHFANISTGDHVCIACQDPYRNDYSNEQFHTFEGDNLAYMELQKKKQELLNEQA